MFYDTLNRLSRLAMFMSTLFNPCEVEQEQIAGKKDMQVSSDATSAIDTNIAVCGIAGSNTKNSVSLCSTYKYFCSPYIQTKFST